MNRRPWFPFVVIALYVVATFGMGRVRSLMGASPADTTTDAPFITIQPPIAGGAGISQVAWVGDWLVLEEGDSRTNTVPAFRTALWMVRPNGEGMKPLPITFSGTYCGKDTPFFAFGNPLRFRDNEVAFTEGCSAPNPNVPTAAASLGTTILRVLDLDSGTIVLSEGMAFKGTPRFNLWGIALNAQESWALTPVANEDELARQAIRRLAKDIPPGKILERPTMPMTQIWAMSLSPDGTQIAFAGRSGDREEPSSTVDGQLFISDTHLLNARPVGPELHSMRGASWSPDGKWLLTSGKKGATRGLWIVETTTGEMRFVAEGWFGISPTAWSSDGTRVAVNNFFGDSSDAPNVIAVFDLAAILGESDTAP